LPATGSQLEQQQQQRGNRQNNRLLQNCRKYNNSLEPIASVVDTWMGESIYAIFIID